MSKTVQDYREIVKVLKLQLLKVRQENSTLSKSLGISSETQSSSFTPRLEKLKASSKQFAKHAYLFNYFAHRCELIGVTPEMVFRIADKKRDKKVSVADLTQIMKRLRMGFNDVEISSFLRLITKSNSIFYEQYLQFLSAFSINSEKYPKKSQRTYPQLSLLRLAQSVQKSQKDATAESIVKAISNNDGRSYITYQNFITYCQSKGLKDAQMVSIFVMLDTQTQCSIQKQSLKRQLSKALNLLSKGQPIDLQPEDFPQSLPIDSYKQRRVPDAAPIFKDDQGFDVDEETGVEAKGKVKKVVKKETKLTKGELSKLVLEIKKDGIPINTLISKLLENEVKKKLVRPFSLSDWNSTISSINKKIKKKRILQFFKCMDTSNNGSVSTDQLIKLWLQGRQVTDSNEILLKLLGRHFKQIQSQQYITRFSTCGYKGEDKINAPMLADVLEGLQLKNQYLTLIVNNLPTNCTVNDFVELLETGGIKKSVGGFQKLDKKLYENMKDAVKSLLPKQSKNFPKYNRLEDQNPETSSQKTQKWQTIFTDEWACWNYCLQAAYKLSSNWRDPEFGPTKGDPKGYRSLVGNQSNVPPGFPMQDDISWATFQQILEKQNNTTDDVKLFGNQLSANDIVQGKIGDCWFVSALSIIAPNEDYVKGKSQKQCQAKPQLLTYGVHPAMFHIFRDWGIYVFKFFKSFQPVYVVVDDLFPVQTSSFQLIFARSPNPGIQWVAFVEKAYTKLHHCYTNMISGDIAQGINDLTNNLPIKQDLSKNNPQQLWEKMLRLHQEHQLMGCSINTPKTSSSSAAEQAVKYNDQRTGLFSGHAYSVGDVIPLKTKDQEFELIRVRNPWGHGEWMLDWSDKPEDEDYRKLEKYQKDLDQYYQKKIQNAKKMRENIVITKYQPGDDGDFLMNFNDFSQIYHNLFTGYQLSNKNYACYEFNSKWNQEYPSGICKAKNAPEADRIKFVKNNFQFVFEVKQQKDILIFLIQQDGRLFRGQKYPYKEICNGMMLIAFELESREKMLEKFDQNKFVIKALKFELKREVSLWHKFKPGKYAIVPCRMGVSQDKVQQDFSMRIYAQNDLKITQMKGTKGEFKQIPKEQKPTNSGALRTMSDIVFKSK